MKGQAEMLIGIGVYFILIMILFSFSFGNSATDTRTVAEDNLLFAGDKVETYVRSFLQSLKLSLLQSTYDAGISYADKNWQCYSSNCLLDVCSLKNIGNDILSGSSQLKGTTNYVNEYLSAYKNLVKNDEQDIVAPESISSGSDSSLSLGMENVSAKWPSASFKYCEKRAPDAKDCILDSKIIIDRKFSPDAGIDTVFGQMYDVSQNLINNDKVLNDVVLPALQGCTPLTTLSDIESKINSNFDALQNSLSTSSYQLNFTDRRIEFVPILCQASVRTVVNVTETGYPKYALWDGSSVIQDHLHLKFTVISGTDPTLIGCNVWIR